MGKIRESGMYLNSGRIINIFLSIVIIIGLAFSKQILVGLG